MPTDPINPDPNEAPSQIRTRLYRECVATWRKNPRIIGVLIGARQSNCFVCPQWHGYYHLDSAPEGPPSACILANGCTASFEPILVDEAPSGL